jgi:transcriptional regulator with XRE-family HTH domain|nr:MULTISPECIES: helix-turn-helix transcriptional regulator [Butyrivibrio]
MAKEQYGKRVKELRQSCGLTQSDLAKALGVTPGYISNVENNRTAMSLHILIYFAQLTGQTLDSLVGELEPAYKQSAIDKKINTIVSKLSNKDKEKLVKMLSVWSK